MSEQILDEFERHFNDISRKEVKRAERLKKVTKDVDIAHLLCGYGRAAREALEAVLLLSSPLSFDTFLAHCFRNNPCQSQDNVAFIKVIAKCQQVHPSKILFQHLPRMVPDNSLSVKDLIDSLEHAHLYRAIASLEKVDLDALAKHSRSNTGCSLPNVPLLLTNTKEPSQKVIKSNNSAKSPRGVILLSFARDGQEIANQLKHELGKPFGKSKRPYLVLTLSQYTSYIAENPVEHLKHLISEVNYVVPILTEGYFEILEKRALPEGATFDEEFSTLLNQLVVDEWANNNFKNEKVRCYRPKEVLSKRTVFPPFSTQISDIVALREVWLKLRQK